MSKKLQWEFFDSHCRYAYAEAEFLETRWNSICLLQGWCY